MRPLDIVRLRHDLKVDVIKEPDLEVYRSDRKRLQGFVRATRIRTVVGVIKKIYLDLKMSGVGLNRS